MNSALSKTNFLKPLKEHSKRTPFNKVRLFYCWITLPADLEKLGLHKKRILPDTVGEMFVFGVLKSSKITEKKLEHCMTSENHAKITIEYARLFSLFFLGVLDLKKKPVGVT